MNDVYEVTLPDTRGHYQVTLEDDTVLVAWFNPSSGHWINTCENSAREIGFGSLIRPIGGHKDLFIKSIVPYAC